MQKTATVPLTVLKRLISLCVADQLHKLKITSGRNVILMSYMKSLVLVAAYSAFLIASLAVLHQDLPFRDLQGPSGTFIQRFVQAHYREE